MRRLGATVAILTANLVVAGGAHAADQTVTATSANRFVPAQVTVSQGEKVTWTNAGGSHNVWFNDGSFVQPMDPALPPWTVERSFNSPGTFGYLCVQHAGVMTGMVTVLAAAQPVPPGGGPPGSPPPTPLPPLLEPLTVTLKVRDSTPAAGARVHLFGAVRPARDGRKVKIQKRTRSGSFKTVADTRLRDAGTAKSQFSLRLRISGGAVFRARVAGDDDRDTGISRTRKVTPAASAVSPTR